MDFYGIVKAVRRLSDEEFALINEKRWSELSDMSEDGKIPPIEVFANEEGTHTPYVVAPFCRRIKTDYHNDGIISEHDACVSHELLYYAGWDDYEYEKEQFKRVLDAAGLGVGSRGSLEWFEITPEIFDIVEGDLASNIPEGTSLLFYADW